MVALLSTGRAPMLALAIVFLLSVAFLQTSCAKRDREDDDDDGDEEEPAECGPPVGKFDSRELTVTVTKKDVRLRRLYAEAGGERCIMARGYQCGRMRRARRHKARKDRQGQASRPGKNETSSEDGDGKKEKRRPGMGHGPMGGPGAKGKGNKRDNDEEEEAGKKGRDGWKRCSRFGKLTVLKLKALYRLKDNATQISKSQIREIIQTENATNTTIPDTVGSDGQKVNAVRFKLALVFPGKDNATNATATMTVYVIKGAGNLTLSPNLTVPIKKGQLKFNFQIDNPTNWLCSNGETGAQCAALVKLQLRLVGEAMLRGKAKGHMKKEKVCKGRRCVRNVITADGSMLSAVNVAKIDDEVTEMDELKTEDDGTMSMLFRFKNKIFIDPIVEPSTEEDEPLSVLAAGSVTSAVTSGFFVMLLATLACMYSV